MDIAGLKRILEKTAEVLCHHTTYCLHPIPYDYYRTMVEGSNSYSVDVALGELENRASFNAYLACRMLDVKDVTEIIYGGRSTEILLALLNRQDFRLASTILNAFKVTDSVDVDIKLVANEHLANMTFRVKGVTSVNNINLMEEKYGYSIYSDSLSRRGELLDALEPFVGPGALDEYKTVEPVKLQTRLLVLDNGKVKVRESSIGTEPLLLKVGNGYRSLLVDRLGFVPYDELTDAMVDGTVAVVVRPGSKVKTKIITRGSSDLWAYNTLP